MLFPQEARHNPMPIIGLIGCAAALLLLYWAIVVGEGTYLGSWAVRLIYQRGAAVYDTVRANVTASDPLHLLGPLRVALAGIGHAQVLDVATGTGRVPLLLVRQPWFEGHIVALDLAPAMLERARAQLAEAGALERVELRCANAAELPWPAESFQVITCLEALEYFPRPRSSLSQMVRLLRPGGTLLISAWTQKYARWMPGKALAAPQMARYLQKLGCAEVEIRTWQPGHYDLLIARKAEV